MDKVRGVWLTWMNPWCDNYELLLGPTKFALVASSTVLRESIYVLWQKLFTYRLQFTISSWILSKRIRFHLLHKWLTDTNLLVDIITLLTTFLLFNECHTCCINEGSFLFLCLTLFKFLLSQCSLHAASTLIFENPKLFDFITCAHVSIL